MKKSNFPPGEPAAAQRDGIETPPKSERRRVTKIPFEKCEVIIGAISDIHYHGNSELLDIAVGQFNAHKALDVLIVPGDLYNFEYDFLNTCLRKLSEIKARHRYFVPGNHDLWREPGETIEEKNMRMNEILAQYDFHNLENGPVLLGRLGIAGNIGWYDYSLKPGFDEDRIFINFMGERKRYGDFTDEDFSAQEYYFEHKGKILCQRWNDVTYFKKRSSDIEYCRSKVRQMEEDILSLRANEAGILCCVTHTVPHVKGVSEYRWPDTPRYAWHGSDEFRKLYEKHGVALAVFGHDHGDRKHFKENGVIYRDAVIWHPPVFRWKI